MSAPTTINEASKATTPSVTTTGQGATDTEKASALPPRVDGGLRGWLTVLGG